MQPAGYMVSFLLGLLLDSAKALPKEETRGRPEKKKSHLPPEPHTSRFLSLNAR
jgi:hypothetical protein